MYRLSLIYKQVTLSFVLRQCFSNFIIPSPPFHSRHVVFDTQAWWSKHNVVNLKNLFKESIKQLNQAINTLN